MVRCHYEVLGLSQTASSDEIPSAYKKLALQWHPDKNQDNIERATAIFKEVQAAYEVLSDKHERAWYDSHKDSILSSHKDSDSADDLVDIWSYFSTSAFSGFHEGTDGFYSVYTEAFKQVYESERFVAKREGRDADLEELEKRRPPDFGGKSASHVDVAAFYRFWLAFASKREFAHADQYNLAEAPNRKVKQGR